MELERTSNKVKVEVLFDMIKNKVDREKGLGFYFTKMGLYSAAAMGASAVAIGSGMVDNSFAAVALATVGVGAAAVVGALKAGLEEKSEVKRVMEEAIKDIATRDDLKPVEKVVLERYFKEQKMPIEQVVKENVLSTDLDLNKLDNLSSARIEQKLKFSNSKFTQEQFAENVQYRPSYLEKSKEELVDRIKNITYSEHEQQGHRLLRKSAI